MSRRKLSIMIASCALLFGARFAFAFDGTYSVPVENVAAKNDISNIEFQKLESTPELKYELPEDLVGPYRHTVILPLVETVSSTDGLQIVFKEGATRAICLGEATGLSCKIKYHKMMIDQGARDFFLRQKYAKNPSFLAEKLKVAAIFGSDPIGILRISCSEENCGF